MTNQMGFIMHKLVASHCHKDHNNELYQNTFSCQKQFNKCRRLKIISLMWNYTNLHKFNMELIIRISHKWLEYVQ